MAENNTGMSGGSMHGGIAIGKSTGNVTSTVHNSGDRSVHNSGTMGNAVTGENNRGNISATIGSSSRKKAIEEVTEDDVVSVLKEKKLGQYASMFREQGIDGSLLHELSDELLTKFEVSDAWDRKRILNLKKHFPK